MTNPIRFVHVLTILAIALAATIMLAVLFREDFVDSELRTQVVTNGINIAMMVIGYWVGSTNGSQHKTNIIAQSQPIMNKDMEVTVATLSTSTPDSNSPKETKP